MWHEDEESEGPIDMIISEVVPVPAYATTRPTIDRSRMSDKMPKENMYWVFAAHHKVGTHLIRSLARYQREALEVLGKIPIQPRDCEQPQCKKGFCSSFWGANAFKGTRMWMACEYSESEYKAMQQFAMNNGSLHTVHVVRDPVAVVISGYLYHLHSDDHCGKQCQMARDMNVSDGVAREAQWALSHTLNDMLRTYELGSNDSGMMTVRMEDFLKSSQEFDITVRRIYEHNEVGLFLTAEQRQALETRAQHQDLKRHPNHDAGHQASAEMKDKAARALQSIPQDLYMQLREAGEKLGYVYQ